MKLFFKLEDIQMSFKGILFIAILFFSCGTTSTSINSIEKINKRLVLGTNNDGTRYYGIWLFEGVLGDTSVGIYDSLFLLVIKNPVQFARYKNYYFFKNETLYKYLEFKNDSILINIQAFYSSRNFSNKLKEINMLDSLHWNSITY